MDRRKFLAGALAALAVDAVAQPARLPRIGVLSMRVTDGTLPFNAALLAGLADNGYVDGRTAIIDFPDVQAREDRLADAAAGLVERRADVILVIGPAPLPAARHATHVIPIVMVASSADPVREGVATSLARPGGNVTGLTYAEPDRFRKQLELVKSMVRQVSRLCVLWDFDLSTYRRDWEAPLADAASLLSITVQDPLQITDNDTLARAFDIMKQRRTDAFIVAAGGSLFAMRAQVAQMALRDRLAGIAAFKQFPEAGLLMSYGPDLGDINRRAGSYVRRILRGVKPGDLPIELPSQFELAINASTARALGLAIDPALLVRATHVYR